MCVMKKTEKMSKKLFTFTLCIAVTNHCSKNKLMRSIGLSQNDIRKNNKKKTVESLEGDGYESGISSNFDCL